MDVRLPDGTLIKGVPEGTTKAQLAEKLKANGYDVGKLGADIKPEIKPTQTNAGLANFMASTLGLPVDTVENALNLGIAGVGSVANAAGRPDLAPDVIRGSVGGSEHIRGLLRKTGQPGLSPDNPMPNDPRATDQFNFTSRGGFIPGGALPAAVSVLAENTLGPEWAGVGSMAPAAAGRGLSAARNAMVDPRVVQQNRETFRRAGTEPDVAQATDSNFAAGLENVISRFPGGQGVMSKFRESQQEQLGQSARTGVSAEAGGRSIKTGITGDGGFLDRTKAQWQKLDNDLGIKVGQGYRLAPTKTSQALDELTAVTPGAEKTSSSLVNARVAEIKQNFAADLQANNGQMPFEALRALRSKVGSLLDDSLVSGIPNGELKKLYGALSKDLEAAAGQAGATREFARQNNYYKARMDRIENTLDAVLGDKKTFEQIFKGVAPTDVDSVNKIRRVFRSLSGEQRDLVARAVVDRLGRATPGQQDATGAKFSSETFLSNWSRINDSAKVQLFPDATMRNKLDAISKVSEEIRKNKQVFGNNSGTAQGVSAAGVYATAPVAVGLAASGNVGAAGAAVAVTSALVVGANIGAKMLTSPKVVDWLAKSSKTTSPEQMTAQLGRLAVIYNQTKDEALKQEMGEYINSVR
jgi:hypothetical protein